MKKITALLFLTIFTAYSNFAQLVDPVKWSYRVEQKGQEATLIFKATVDKGWHVYSQFIPDGGPIPTSFTFTPDNNYTLVGKVSEPKGEEIFDSNFDLKLKFFENSAEFKQKIKLTSNKAFKIKGVVESMACNDKNCTPPNAVDFEFSIAGEATTEVMNPATSTATDESDSVQKITNPAPTATTNSKIPLPSSDLSKLEPACDRGGSIQTEDKSYWGIFLAGMIGGFLALLTPCVFPMIPMTVSFFTKRSPTRAKGIRNAVIYALSIILIYVAIGFFVTITLGSDALNDLASGAFFNLLFFVIFLIFGFSFLGAFEITLPSSWLNKADSASDKGGLIGIFFMAFTLSLVSFSCTGPIIGTLLVEAAKGSSYLGPIMGMTGFSLALAIPFAFFAAFPGWLNTLPKSGGWLNSVKVVFGFVELALALKFLSAVDLAYGLNILQREKFIAIWIAIFGLLSLYLIGKLKFSHDSDLPYISTTRIIFAIISFSFTFYLIPGLFGAPLNLVTGFLPPQTKQEWNPEKEHFNNYEEGMAYAKLVGKPVMIDFTGWSCVNCRKMESTVWKEPKVKNYLSNDYIIISLYVDDKAELPANEQYISKFSGKKIKTTGNKWSDLEASIFNKNVQPYYVLLDNEGKMLAEPRSYTPNVDEYTKFLEEGLCRYKIRNNQ